MDWDPAERDAWVTDAERWIGQINGVLQSKIDLDDAGEVAGVHVVAGMEREPRHIVRDVEGLLKARLDLDVYYKKIGVVQVVDNETLADVALVNARPTVKPAPAGPLPISTDTPAGRLRSARRARISRVTEPMSRPERLAETMATRLLPNRWISEGPVTISMLAMLPRVMGTPSLSVRIRSWTAVKVLRWDPVLRTRMST